MSRKVGEVDKRGSGPTYSFVKACSIFRSSELSQLVRNVTRTRRWHKRCPCAEAWRVYLEAANVKREVIKKVEAAHLKQAVANAARTRKGIWPLAKWAKTRSHLPLTPLSNLTLVTPSRNATTPFDKAEALKARFFPPMPDADLSDIPDASYLPEKHSPMSISEEEISSVIKKSHPFKAAGSDGIPFFVLKCLDSSLVSYFQPLFQACIDFSYHPVAFCYCSTIPLRKPGKGDYSAPGAWRPITRLGRCWRAS